MDLRLDDDDLPVGRIIIRREALKYYIDTRLNRADIRSDAGTGVLRAGIPFALTFNVSRIASGAYSGRHPYPLQHRPHHLMHGYTRRCCGSQPAE
jgi:hypothetical protein